MILLEHELDEFILEGALETALEVEALFLFTKALAPVTQTAAWAAVSGADTVEVTGGSVSVSASAGEETTLSGLSVSKSGRHHVVNFGRKVRLKSLTLSDFTYLPDGEDDFVSFSAGANSRLVVSIPDPQLEWLPLYAVPHVSTNTSPRQYYGASLDGHTLRLPAGMPITDRVRLSVVKKFAKEDEELLENSIGGGSARILNLPEDLKITDEGDGGELFAHDGLYLDGAPATSLDMANHAQAAFDRQLAAGEPLSFAYKIAAKSGTAFLYSAQAVRGALLRNFTGVTAAELAGEPLSLPLDLAAGALAGERPASAAAELTLTYDGLRLLPNYNDPLPAGAAAGRVVREEPAGRLLLDPEIAAYPIARVGLIGRAPEACELSVWLAARQGDHPGAALTDPGVLQLAPSANLAVHWVDLPRPLTGEGGVFLQVRANTGRFFWVTAPDPQLRIVVADPEPGGRPVLIDGELLRQVVEAKTTTEAISLNPERFRHSPPVLSSDLFVTVELTDLTLRYNR